MGTESLFLDATFPSGSWPKGPSPLDEALGLQGTGTVTVSSPASRPNRR